MEEQARRQLALEVSKSKIAEFGTNQEGLFEFLIDAFFMTDEQANAALLQYAEAKKEKLEADKASLASQKLNAERELTTIINETDGIITVLKTGTIA